MKRSKLLPFLLIFILILIFSAFVLNATDISLHWTSDSKSTILNPSPPDNPEAPTKPLDGVIQTGRQIGIDYCAEGYYLNLESETKYYLLRDAETEEMMELANYVSEEVRVTVINEVGDPVYCEALTCGCEGRLLVVDIVNL